MWRAQLSPRRVQAILRDSEICSRPVVSIADSFRPNRDPARALPLSQLIIRFRWWNLADRPIQLFRAHACRTDIWLCMQGFFIRSGQILPTHFTTGRGDHFELHSDRFRRWNLAERPIQLFRAHACRADIWLCMQGFFIRSDQTLPTHFTTFDEVIVLSHIATDSDGGIFWGAFSVQGGAQTPQGSRSGAIEVQFWSFDRRPFLL